MMDLSQETRNTEPTKRRSRLSAIALAMLALSTIIGLVIGQPQPARAEEDFLVSFRGRYPSASGSKLDSCTTCHTDSIPALNPYGADYQRLGRNYSAIEALDSDQDGASNSAEIAALTWPGDPSDKPGTGPAGFIVCLPLINK